MPQKLNFHRFAPLLELMVTLTRFLFVGTVAILLSACASKEILPPGVVPQVQLPSEGEASQARMLSAHYALSNNVGTPVDRGPEVKRVEKIVKRLTDAAGGENGRTFPVTVVKGTDTSNAGMLDGQAIIVHDILLKRVSDDGELAAVLAHEVAHALAGHHLDDNDKRNVQTAAVASRVFGTILGAVVAATTGSVQAGNSAARLGGTVGMVGMGGLALEYSRDMEFEADQVGLFLMARAGYHPEGAIRFWANASEYLGESGVSFLSTHPAHEKRMKRLEELLPQAVAEYESYKARTAPPASRKQSARKS